MRENLKNSIVNENALDSEGALRLYSETKLTLILDSNSSKYRSSVVGVGLTRV